MSHVVAMLSGMFPEGEEFFIRSVQHFSNQVIDTTLKEQVRGFIGQEKTHGREHRQLNERLQQMGYPTRFANRTVRRDLNFGSRRYPPRYALAVTAAMEHYTAVLAETLLTNEEAQDLLGDGEVRSMLLWHALEESEHRAVAFDVYKMVGGTERMRIWAMRITTLVLLVATIFMTLVSLSKDRQAYNPIRLFRSIAALRHSPFLSKPLIGRIRAYNRPGFHPNEFDNTELIDRWSAQLFGEHGQLAANLH